MDSFFWFHIEVEDLNGICLLPSSSGRGAAEECSTTDQKLNSLIYY